LARSPSALASAFAPIFPHRKHAFPLQRRVGAARILNTDLTVRSALESVVFAQNRNTCDTALLTIPLPPKSGISFGTDT
jgi:hypothetical protein